MRDPTASIADGLLPKCSASNPRRPRRVGVDITAPGPPSLTAPKARISWVGRMLAQPASPLAMKFSKICHTVDVPPARCAYTTFEQVERNRLQRVKLYPGKKE